MNPNITVINDQVDVIRATQVVLNVGLRPTRIVLRDLGNKFVTHREYMHVRVETQTIGSRVVPGAEHTYDCIICAHEAYEHGHYFEYKPGDGTSKANAYNEATDDFEERARKV